MIPAFVNLMCLKLGMMGTMVFRLLILVCFFPFIAVGFVFSLSCYVPLCFHTPSYLKLKAKRIYVLPFHTYFIIVLHVPLMICN
jgi:hypothetical protein